MAMKTTISSAVSMATTRFTVATAMIGSMPAAVTITPMAKPVMILWRAVMALMASMVARDSIGFMDRIATTAWRVGMMPTPFPAVWVTIRYPAAPELTPLMPGPGMTRFLVMKTTTRLRVAVVTTRSMDRRAMICCTDRAEWTRSLAPMATIRSTVGMTMTHWSALPARMSFTAATEMTRLMEMRTTI